VCHREGIVVAHHAKPVFSTFRRIETLRLKAINRMAVRTVQRLVQHDT
jgi:hypothetical protein